MQEHVNKRLALLLAILVSVIVALVFWQTRRNGAEVDPTLYSNFDLKSVDKVILESTTGKTELSFQGYRWRVNNSFDADRSLIEVLFATVKQAVAKRPVAQSAKDSIINSLKKEGVKVSLFSKDALVESFYAGGNDAKTQAVFFKETVETPHIMVIPGYRVYVSGIFELPSTGWREKLIFNFNWQNFSGLQARYKNPAGNFDLSMQKGQVFVDGLADSDTAKVNTYLNDVSLLTVDEFIANNSLTDSLGSTQPLVKLTVSDIANRQYLMEVFATDNEFYSRINGELWAIINRDKIIPLLRPKEFFIKR